MAFVGGFLFFRSSKNVTENTTATTTNSTTSTTTLGNLGITTEGSGNYTITQISSTDIKNSSVPVPNLKRQTVFSPNLPVESKTYFTAKIQSLQTVLTKDNGDLRSWIELGLAQKAVGDYEGSRDSWIYVSKMSPTDYISRGNLGDLYAYYLRDNAQAEMYFKQSIAQGPTQSYLYVQFAGMYKDVFKDISKARVVVDQGLNKIPNDPALLELKKNLSGL